MLCRATLQGVWIGGQTMDSFYFCDTEIFVSDLQNRPPHCHVSRMIPTQGDTVPTAVHAMLQGPVEIEMDLQSREPAAQAVLGGDALGLPHPCDPPSLVS